MDNKSNISLWQSVKTGIIFQFKLLLDAGRDLLLSPVSIVCLLLDLINKNEANNGYYHRLMQLGQQSDHWINLFSHHKETQAEDTDNAKAMKVDDLIEKLELSLAHEAKNKTVSTAAVNRIQQLLSKSQQHASTADHTHSTSDNNSSAVEKNTTNSDKN